VILNGREEIRIEPKKIDMTKYENMMKLLVPFFEKIVASQPAPQAQNPQQRNSL
jgi:hypothetical protein